MKIPASDVNIPESWIKYDVLLDAKEVGNSSNSLFTPRVVVGKYLKIFHLGEGEISLLLRMNWEMSQTYSSKDNMWSIFEIADGERKVSHANPYSSFSCHTVCVHWPVTNRWNHTILKTSAHIVFWMPHRGNKNRLLKSWYSLYKPTPWFQGQN